jgi:hypothetical protein
MAMNIMMRRAGNNILQFENINYISHFNNYITTKLSMDGNFAE